MAARHPLLAAAAALFCSAPLNAATLRLTAYGPDGRLLSKRQLMEFIAPASLQGKAKAETSALFVTDMDGDPVPGRPWWVAGSSVAEISWSGTARVKLGLPWPVADDGFSTVTLDKNGQGYGDGEIANLNEEIARTEYRLFQTFLKDRRTDRLPPYKASLESARMQREAEDALAAAIAAPSQPERAALFDKALTKISLAWAKTLFEHGGQAARDRAIGANLRWGITLDDTLVNRLSDYKSILKEIDRSGATWVRLVFRLNPDDFSYASPRSFIEYDHFVQDLTSRRVRIMGSILDSSLWTPKLTPEAVRQRTRNLVLHYKNSIRSWETASEPNGTCLGGCESPLPPDTIERSIRAAAEEVKSADPSLETVATLYWWEGTAEDDTHPTLVWAKHAARTGLFDAIDVVGLSVYPEDNPFGLAFDPTFQALADRFPSKKIMLSGFGYASNGTLRGYWWLNPDDVDGARKDLLVLYTGAACAIPRTLGGGFFWDSLTQLVGPNREAADTLKVYRKTLHELGR